MLNYHSMTVILVTLGLIEVFFCPVSFFPLTFGHVEILHSNTPSHAKPQLDVHFGRFWVDKKYFVGISFVPEKNPNTHMV